MILNLHKKNRKILAAVLVTLLSAGIFKLGGILITGTIDVIGKSTATEKQTVIIDAGHGGIDGGAVGFNDVIEKNINLSISQKLKSMLELNGYNVVMTRDDDVSIHDSDAVTTREKKSSDLNNRMKIIKKYEDAYFVSIHQNYFEQSQYWGTQIFYGPQNEDSEKLASILQDNFRTYLQPENEREIKQAQDNIYLIYYSKLPTVLVECGFISNPDEAEKLQDDDYQNKIAFIIFNSILQYDMSQK